jgi:exodeoxyribonuclease V alpha subunit
VVATEVPSEVLEGQVTRILFRDEGSLFTALKVRPAQGGRDVSVVGELLNVAVDDEYTFTGQWVRHPKWGPQFQVAQALRKLPQKPEAIVGYLSGGLFPGVGRSLAKRLVDHFGPATLQVILTQPEAIDGVPGIGKKRRLRLAAALLQHRHIHDLALFLQGHGVSLFLTKKLHERYGAQALEVVKTDPYRCADEIAGIGFLRADTIARKTGLPPDAPGRIRASIAYVLRDRCEVRGHSFLPEPELIRECLSFLNRDVDTPVRPALVQAEITTLVEGGRLVRELPHSLYLREAHQAEVRLAQRLRTLLQATVGVHQGLDRAVREAEAAAGISYADEQLQAIQTTLRSGVAVITGGPGTGKSTVIRGVVSALRRLRPSARVLLAAPTGRAAKRVSEVTGEAARTIHRLLEFSPEHGSFTRGEDDPLDVDLLVVDEASMVDLLLADALLCAVPAGAQVLLVGDADQLPSVGFGNVFADLIRSGAVPVVSLRHIFRQAQQSRIVTNAHLINHGRMPVLERGSDCEFVPKGSDAEVAAFLRDAAVQQRAAGCSLEEINVLTPMRKTEVGVAALNTLLQAALNPPAPSKPEMALGGSVLRLGDKVMQIRNNYDKGVFNGDMGVIVAVRLEGAEDDDAEPEDEGVVVDFQGADVTYLRSELEQLVLAYACTIHKAQGSEYPGVVLIPVVTSHYVMLQRNLLYTAITRAKEHAILVGQVAAIRRAVNNVGSRQRYSRLAERLQPQA